MGRAWRIEYEGGLYHVLSRGNERKDIFYDDRDRSIFLDVIGEMVDGYGVDIFAYVLMGNHYHLLLRTNYANLSKSMQWLALTYTRRFNNRHFRSPKCLWKGAEKAASRSVLGGRERKI